LASAAACTSSDSGVTTGLVSRSTVTEVVDAPASVTARAAATLTAPSDGTISVLAVGPGATVSKGTVLAVVDSPQAQQRLADRTEALAGADKVGSRWTVDLVSLQSTIGSAETDALAAARAAAGMGSDPDVRAALLAEVDASQKRCDAAAASSRRILGQVEQ